MLLSQTACSQTRSSQQPTTGAGSINRLYTFKQVRCDYGKLSIETRCGYLAVPQDHDRPSGPRLLLAVTILKARNRNPAPDPVVYLAGGPGGSATLDIETWLEQDFLRRRDLILIDQRGTGASKPVLNCPELEISDERTEVEAARACHDRLLGEGIDLNLFTTTQSAADLDALRQVLGYKKWNLLGVSYGSRLALTMVQNYPDTIRSIILDSAYPPQIKAYEERAVNGALAIQAFFQGCVDDPLCNKAFPNLQQVFEALLSRFEQTPVEVTLFDVTSKSEINLLLDGSELADQIYDALYSVNTLELIPYVIYQLDQGNYHALELLGNLTNLHNHALQTSEDLSKSEGFFYSIECREEIPFNDLDAAVQAAQDGPAIARYLIGDIRTMFAICSFWGTGETSESEKLPVQSDLNTLILSGQYDPVSPPIWGQMVSQYLPRSQYFLFPGMGHSVIFDNPCPRSVIVDFLEAPRQSLKPACIETMHGSSVYLP
ncbi:MAG: alpha/beta fold hydrolase [Chloroflexota bacterium]